MADMDSAEYTKLNKRLTNLSNAIQQLADNYNYILTLLAQKTDLVKFNQNNLYLKNEIQGLRISLTTPELTLNVRASENLNIGDFVNLYLLGNSLRVRKANATDNTKPADGFVLNNFNSGELCVIYLPPSINTQLSNLTIGTEYFLDINGGQITKDPPELDGNLIQLIGIAISTTNLLFISTRAITTEL